MSPITIVIIGGVVGLGMILGIAGYMDAQARKRTGMNSPRHGSAPSSIPKGVPAWMSTVEPEKLVASYQRVEKEIRSTANLLLTLGGLETLIAFSILLTTTRFSWGMPSSILLIAVALISLRYPEPASSGVAQITLLALAINQFLTPNVTVLTKIISVVLLIWLHFQYVNTRGLIRYYPSFPESLKPPLVEEKAQYRFPLWALVLGPISLVGIGLALEIMGAIVFKMRGIVDVTLLHLLFIAAYGWVLPQVFPA